MTNLIEKVLSAGGGALTMTRDKATALVNDLVEKGQVRREEAQVLIDTLVAQGQEKSVNLRETLAAQITALSAIMETIQDGLSTGTEETVEKARQELNLLNEQVAKVRGRLSKAGAQVEENTRQTLDQAGEQLATAQAHLGQMAAKIQAGAIEDARRGTEALRTTLNNARDILRKR